MVVRRLVLPVQVLDWECQGLLYSESRYLDSPVDFVVGLLVRDVVLDLGYRLDRWGWRGR
jgi:hypothetical protein